MLAAACNLGAAVRVPVRLGGRAEVPVYVLGSAELLQPLLSQLAAAAGHAHAAKRAGVVVRQRIIDPNCAGAHLVKKALDAVGCSAPTKLEEKCLSKSSFSDSSQAGNANVFVKLMATLRT